MSYPNTRKKTKHDLLSRVGPAELKRLRVARRVNFNWRTNKQDQPNSAPLLRSIDDPRLVKVHLNPDELNRPIFYLDYISVNEVDSPKEEKRKGSRERTIFQARRGRAETPPATRATSRNTNSDSGSSSRSRSRSTDRNVRSSDLVNRSLRKSPEERNSKNPRYDSKEECETSAERTRRKSRSPAKPRDGSPRDVSSGRYSRQDTADRQRKSSPSRSPPRPAPYREPVELLSSYRRPHVRTPSPTYGKSKEHHQGSRYGGSHSPPSARYDRLKRSSRSPPHSLRDRLFNKETDLNRRERSPPRSSPRRERSPKAGPSSSSTYRDKSPPPHRYKDPPRPNIQRTRSSSPVASGNSRGETRRRSSRSPPSRDHSDSGYAKRGRYEDHNVSSRSSPSRRVPLTSPSSLEKSRRPSPSSRDHPRRRTRSRSTSRERRYGRGSRSPTRHHYHGDREGRERSDYHRKYEKPRRRTGSRSPPASSSFRRRAGDDDRRSAERRGHRYGAVRSSSRNRRERSPLSKQRSLHQQQPPGYPGPGPIVTPYGIFPGEEYWIPGALPPQAFMPRVFIPTPGAFPRGAVAPMPGGPPGAMLHPRMAPMMPPRPPLFRPPLQRLPVYNSAKIIRPKITAAAATSTTTANNPPTTTADQQQKDNKNPSSSSSTNTSSSNNSNISNSAGSSAVQPTETRGDRDTNNEKSNASSGGSTANNTSNSGTVVSPESSNHVVTQADTAGHVTTSVTVVRRNTDNDGRHCTAVGTTDDVIDGDEPVHSSSP